MSNNLNHLRPCTPTDLDTLFSELHPPLSVRAAVTESQRCLYCSDPPCMRACPTQIDIPAFISGVAQNNLNGAAQTILKENILGGSCARVCPTEILCEQACVLDFDDAKPVQIALLQRHALDHAQFTKHPFERAPSTGYHIAVVGAGPAGLSCAHRLAVLGNDVTVYEAAGKPGGLNEYGVARYKLTDNFAQREIAFLLEIGGILIQYEQRLNLNRDLAQLLDQFDAVFLATGLGAARQLGLEHEDSPGMSAALDTISALRQAKDLTQLPVPKSCIVLGAGNTAVDMAIQARRLGAQQVTLVYRRGEQDISATARELQLAFQHQVRLITWAQPIKILLNSHQKVRGLRCEKTAVTAGRLHGTGEQFDLLADAVFTALGQQPDPATFADHALRMEHGKIWIDANFQTSTARVYAGGDCVMRDPDLTVYAVQHGKLAARAIHQALQQTEVHHG